MTMNNAKGRAERIAKALEGRVSFGNAEPDAASPPPALESLPLECEVYHAQGRTPHLGVVKHMESDIGGELYTVEWSGGHVRTGYYRRSDLRDAKAVEATTAADPEVVSVEAVEEALAEYDLGTSSTSPPSSAKEDTSGETGGYDEPELDLTARETNPYPLDPKDYPKPSTQAEDDVDEADVTSDSSSDSDKAASGEGGAGA